MLHEATLYPPDYWLTMNNMMGMPVTSEKIDVMLLNITISVTSPKDDFSDVVMEIAARS